ncbi:hypothetical protein DFH09DRAFT_1448222 [Mycena vulgaris]|nr:hypothetical protein DFH09DRAFT_1448222 [Mycena vulgaris]
MFHGRAPQPAVASGSSKLIRAIVLNYSRVYPPLVQTVLYAIFIVFDRHRQLHPPGSRPQLPLQDYCSPSYVWNLYGLSHAVEVHLLRDDLKVLLPWISSNPLTLRLPSRKIHPRILQRAHTSPGRDFAPRAACAPEMRGRGPLQYLLPPSLCSTARPRDIDEWHDKWLVRQECVFTQACPRTRIARPSAARDPGQIIRRAAQRRGTRFAAGVWCSDVQWHGSHTPATCALFWVWLSS